MGMATLSLKHGDVEIEMVPERGGLVSRLAVAGRELLYLDRDTVEDKSRSVRGGIPLLFPFAGGLVDNKFLPAGTTIPKHGFGRHSPWHVVEQAPGFVRVELPTTDAMRSVFPYDFSVDYTVMALSRGAQVELLISNFGDKPMPVSPGFHPYFTCPGPLKTQVRSDVAALDPQRFANDVEFDFGVTAPPQGRARFNIPTMGMLHLSWSPEMRFLQCWSLPGKDFICLEPFTGPDNAVNTPARLDIPPGQARALWMRMELEN